VKLAIIGWPIGHSKSPPMQTAALAALGLDGESTAHAVAPDELAQFVEHAPQKGFRGVNVTSPHNEAALKLCAPD
jgi:shikimate dehydrogenase